MSVSLKTLFNTKTTTLDLSTAIFKDSSATPATTIGSATSSQLSLYQANDAINAATYALIPVKLDISNSDTFEISFKYNYGTYAPHYYYEGMVLGFLLNAGNFANFAPAETAAGLGIGGVLDLTYAMGQKPSLYSSPTYWEWDLSARIPPRTEYPSGLYVNDSTVSVNADASLGCTAPDDNAYNGTSTVTLRVRLVKAVTGLGAGAEKTEQCSLQVVSITQDGRVIKADNSSYPNQDEYDLFLTNSAGTLPDVLASPYQPLTLTPYFRRRTFYDVAANPQTISNVTITTGSGTEPPFWTDEIGCIAT